MNEVNDFTVREYSAPMSSSTYLNVWARPQALIGPLTLVDDISVNDR